MLKLERNHKKANTSPQELDNSGVIISSKNFLMLRDANDKTN